MVGMRASPCHAMTMTGMLFDKITLISITNCCKCRPETQDKAATPRRTPCQSTGSGLNRGQGIFGDFPVSHCSTIGRSLEDYCDLRIVPGFRLVVCGTRAADGVLWIRPALTGTTLRQQLQPGLRCRYSPNRLDIGLPRGRQSRRCWTPALGRMRPQQLAGPRQSVDSLCDNWRRGIQRRD